MKIKTLIIAGLIISNIGYGQTIYQEDFRQFWTDINENYAYFREQDIDWKKVKEIYSPVADTITSRESFIKFLENVFYELHNGHCSLNTNLPSSNKLIPTGQDIFVEKIGPQFIITDIRKGSGAEQCGLRTGMQLVKFNGKQIEEQLVQFLPKYTSQQDREMYQFAVSMLFAGTHDRERIVTILTNRNEKDYYPDKYKSAEDNSLMEFRILKNNVGYIRINNSLYNNDLIALFDSALNSLMDTRALVLDLSETPSGGNSTVARAIMGRFINKRSPYQQHECDEWGFDTKRNWVEYVMPRGKTYKGKLILMVGHWTGSMGEGMAIGFDAMNRATIVGTPMARLIGAVYGFKLSHTGIGFQFPAERLYQVNGTPREKFLPQVLTKNSEDTWRRAMELLNTK